MSLTIAKPSKLQQALLDESIEIRLPPLWRYEVGNVLGLKKPTLAVELMSALLAYEFDHVAPSLIKNIGQLVCL